MWPSNTCNYNQEEDRLFTRSDSGITTENGFKGKEGRLRLDVREIFFPSGDDEVLEQAAKRSYGSSIPEGFQGQVGWGMGNQAGCNSAHGGEVGTELSLRCLPI